jgi:gliding motility-associated-like protein
MKRITLTSILLLLVSSITFGQVTVSRQVIGSTGGFSTGSTMTLSSTVGEAVVQTVFSVNSILTQGFQQTLSLDSVVTYEVINESCPGANNGSIYIEDVLGCSDPYTVAITMVGDSTTQYGQDTLGAGDYNVVITGSNGCAYTQLITVGRDSEEDCILKFYSGFTPNGDGVNDVWIIDNIEQFPENTVKIFNRWGNVIWSGTGYDNTNVVWGGLNSTGAEMVTATYFYVVTLDGKTYKGWLELTI